MRKKHVDHIKQKQKNNCKSQNTRQSQFRKKASYVKRFKGYDNRKNRNFPIKFDILYRI